MQDGEGGTGSVGVEGVARCHILMNKVYTISELSGIVREAIPR